MSRAFLDYFQCPRDLVVFDTADELSSEQGFFRLGDVVCYGRRSVGSPIERVNGGRHDVAKAVSVGRGRVALPFDLSEVVTNLRQERYQSDASNWLESLTASDAPRALYYFLRPALPVALRRHLQKVRLHGWDRIEFPSWPVDLSVETLMRRAMGLVLESGVPRVPFVWFWPDGASSCAIVTHDVEGPAGSAFCGRLMDLDDRFGIKAAFQIVPESRRVASDALRDELLARGFEVNLHDLSHDGHLFHEREGFLRRAARINDYARELGCRGFRSAAMYRKQEWFGAFEFSYDMSVPNVAHLEPQRGGCCTVMPYFVDDILELPLTTTQDYSLFHILDDYSTTLWREQIELILEQNGLISFIAHPDYLLEERAQRGYLELLAELGRIRDERQVWVALPGEVDRWWRNRDRMRVVRDGESWRIVGPDSARARLAYATLDDDDRVVYSVAEGTRVPA